MKNKCKKGKPNFRNWDSLWTSSSRKIFSDGDARNMSYDHFVRTNFHDFTVPSYYLETFSEIYWRCIKNTTKTKARFDNLFWEVSLYEKKLLKLTIENCHICEREYEKPPFCRHWKPIKHGLQTGTKKVEIVKNYKTEISHECRLING